MFKNFDATKLHLTELAEIINKFKSEAVQLRVIELLLNSSGSGGNAVAVQESTTLDRQPKSKRKARSKSPSKSDESRAPKKKTSSGAGAVATLVKTFEDGYFKQPRTIGDICAHCEVNLARRIKPNEISGKLGRMVRSRELSRTKNSDGQYVYTNA